MPRTTRECKPSTSRLLSSTVFDEDFDIDGNPTQNSEVLVTNFVKYIINNSATKIPIKRNESMKQLGIPQRLITEIFNESKAFLEDIYGIELVELTETKSTKCYITFPCKKLSTSLILNSQSTDDLKILFIVLSYLFMKTGEVQEVNLIIFLEKLGVNIDEFHKTKEKFIKQLYLKRRKVDIEGQNESHFYYSWGERATLEFNKQDILEVVAKLLNKPATNFVAQHRDAYGDEPIETQDFVMHE